MAFRRGVSNKFETISDVLGSIDPNSGVFAVKKTGNYLIQVRFDNWRYGKNADHEVTLLVNDQSKNNDEQFSHYDSSLESSQQIYVVFSKTIQLKKDDRLDIFIQSVIQSGQRVRYNFLSVVFLSH